MVRFGARRGDDDLGLVTDRTGRIESRAVTASSRGVRGRHSTSDIPSTSAPIGPATRIPFRTHPPTTSHHPYTPVPYDSYGYSHPPQTSYDPYAHAPSLPIRMPGLDPTQYFSKTQIPLNKVDSSYSGAEYGATARGNPSSDAGLGRESVMSKIAGSREKRPEKSRPPTNPMQKKKSKNDGWEQIGPADGGPQDPVLILLYSGHVVGNIWRGEDRGILKSRSRYVSLIGLDIPEFSYVCTSGETGSEVVQTAHPEVCDVGSQNGEQIN
ncbi:hypothetical protein M9H77_18224 [Catharanthus roseus]|uniref:Uncharacterized protein n=1 Tax=Catharanthus roseus TaxID=4058 RepID=A0ACC0B6V1_CATRO|nr:hypothetical protein M9H77_18224 [Catharanthus roseus]